MPLDWLKRYQSWMLVALLVLVIGIFYFPALTSYFVSDDFVFISWIVFNSQSLLAGNKWHEWIFGIMDGYLFFRPVGHLLLFVDYLMWGIEPLGYHFTNILIHILATFEVLLLSWRITKDKATAFAAALLFATMPVHVTVVSWPVARYDLLAGFWCLTSLLFFVLYRQRSKSFFYLMAAVSFALALSSKEIAITFPLIILLYDILFNGEKRFPLIIWIKRHALIWIVLSAYIVFRFSWLGTFGYKGMQITAQDLQNWVNGIWYIIVFPFLPETNGIINLLLYATTLIILVLYRRRREVWMGVLWIPIAYIPVISSISGLSGRSFYIASVGLSLALSSISINLTNRGRLGKILGIGILLVTISGFGQALYSLNLVFHQAGEVAEAIPSQVKKLYPTLPSDARLIFTGVPDRTSDGTLIYLTGFGDSLALVYGTRDLRVFKFEKFPLWLDSLDHTFLFQVDHRRVYERTDLIAALEARKTCSDFSKPAITWDFAQDTQTWEAWNDLDDLTARDGVLVARAVGNDPMLGSPSFDISSIAIGDIVITMRAKASQPTLRGNIYWLATNQIDFYPGLNKSFAVQADGEFHTYSVDLAQTGALLVGDHITQLRFDPVDAPAEIAIQKIEIMTHCASLDNQRCSCGK